MAANRFERDKAWADAHKPEIEEILRRVLGQRLDVEPTTYERDVNEAIDYEVELPKNMVACRIRRIESCGALRQMTVQTSARRGRRSEAMKLGGGQVDWYLYGWSDGTALLDWMVVDVSRVLAAGLMDQAMERGAEVWYSDGRFLYIPAGELERARAVTAASWMP